MSLLTADTVTATAETNVTVSGINRLSTGATTAALPFISLKTGTAMALDELKGFENDRAKVEVVTSGSDYQLVVTKYKDISGLSGNAQNLPVFNESSTALQNELTNYFDQLAVDSWYTGGTLIDEDPTKDLETVSGNDQANNALALHSTIKNLTANAAGRVNAWQRATIPQLVLDASGPNGSTAPGAAYAENPANRFWLRGGYARADMDNRGAQTGFDADIYSTALGYDLVLTENWLAGLTLGYAYTDLEAKRGGHTDIETDTWFVGLYGGFSLDNWLARADIYYAYSDSESKNRYTTGNARTEGDWNTHHFGVDLEAAYRFNIDGLINVSPFVGLEYYHASQESYSEKLVSGSGNAARHFGSQDYDSFQIPVGLRFDGTYQMGDSATLSPELTLAYAHEFGDKDGKIKARYVGGTDSWTAKSVDPGRDAFLAGFALKAEFNETFEAAIGYNLELRQRYMENSVDLQFGYKF